MSGYRWPIPPADRWAIIAYVRELERKRLASAEPPTRPPQLEPAESTRSEARDERCDEPQTAGPSRSRRRLVMFAAAVWIALVADEPTNTRSRTALLPRPSTRRRAPRDWPPRRPTAEAKAKDKPYVEAEYRTFPGRRQPRGHLDGRAAPPAVRGVRPCRPDLRVHRRGDRLQDRGSAIRPARPRVHEAPLRLVLAHRDVRRGADVHAHHPVSEVHELPDERVLSDVPPVRAAVLRRSLLPLHLLLRLGEVPSRSCILAWGSASTSSARRSC